jgi:hypothetical protein
MNINKGIIICVLIVIILIIVLLINNKGVENIILIENPINNIYMLIGPDKIRYNYKKRIMDKLYYFITENHTYDNLILNLKYELPNIYVDELKPKIYKSNIKVKEIKLNDIYKFNSEGNGDIDIIFKNI